MVFLRHLPQCRSHPTKPPNDCKQITSTFLINQAGGHETSAPLTMSFLDFQHLHGVTQLPLWFPPPALFVPRTSDSTNIASTQRPACGSSPSRRWPPDHAAQYREGVGGGNQLSLRSQLTVRRNEFGLGEICVDSLRSDSQQTRWSLVKATAATRLRSASVALPQTPSRTARRKAVDGQLREGGQRATR